MKKAAILAAPGFEEIELMAPLDILRRLNFDVQLAGVQSDKVVSTHDVTVTTDTMLDKLHADKLDALILPGGAGAWVLRDTPEVIHLVKKMHAAGKLVAAICAALSFWRKPVWSRTRTLRPTRPRTSTGNSMRREPHREG